MQIYYSAIESDQVIKDLNFDQIVKIDHETGQVEISHATDIELINQQVQITIEALVNNKVRAQLLLDINYRVQNYDDLQTGITPLENGLSD